MDIFSTGCFKTILERYAEPIMRKVIEITKDEWEKFKVDFDIVFVEYMKNSYDKYSKIKTILYRTEPKYIYDFFEVPILTLGNKKYFKADSVNSVLDISNFIIIQGTGGIGKSTLMKHLFINELEKKDLIPIFFELKDINDLGTDYEIGKIILEKINNLGSRLNIKYFEYALKSGCFLFLFDGYDEILTKNRDSLFKKLDSFCDKYSQNYYVISSRPFSEFVEFQRFTVINTCPFFKHQAIELVNKIDFEKDIKQRFVNALDIELFEKHESFASNPLLLNIMLLTYDNYAEIPEKLHLFYANAFETMYSKHDATKAGYRREMKSELSYDSFKKVFSYFCFATYVQGRTEFSYDDLVVALNRIPANKIVFEVSNYIYDLVDALCVLYREGLSYKFTHRSFQEYFVAFFLKELPDESMKQLGKQIIYKDSFRASNDNVFGMLCDMAEDRYEQNILLPILKEYEKEASNDKYAFYFSRLVQKIIFDDNPEIKDGEIVLCLSMSNRDNILHFIRKYIYQCLIKSEQEEREQLASDRIFDYLITNKGYQIGMELELNDILTDYALYDLLKETWIGREVYIMSKLNEQLEIKQEKMELDLFDLLF